MSDLPNPGMSFTPFDPLAASELNDMVENIESVADGSAFDKTTEFPWDDADTAYVATSESLNTTGYTDLTTVTDTVTITVGSSGKVLVGIGAYLQNTTSGAVASMGFAISGTNTLAAADKYAIQYQSFTSNAFGRLGNSFLLKGLTPGSTTFKAKYKASGNFSTWAERHISAIPL